MITLLTEESYSGWLVEHPNCVILGWMENCTFCEQFKPIFESVAQDKAFAMWSFASFKSPAQVANSNANLCEPASVRELGRRVSFCFVMVNTSRVIMA